MGLLEDVTDRVTRLGATDKRPEVSADQVGKIIAAHALVDVNGVAPGQPGWEPTYDTNAAIAEVWDTKAAAVAGDYSFKADNAEFSKGDVLAHMLAMRAQYAALAVDAVGRSTSGAGTFQVAGTNGPFDPLERVAERVIP